MKSDKDPKKSKKSKRKRRDEYNLHFDDLLDDCYEEFLAYLYEEDGYTKTPKGSKQADSKGRGKKA